VNTAWSFVAPFIGSDQGDVYVFDSLAEMYSDIEAVDASTIEFFDAAGRPIRAIVERSRWRIDGEHVDPPDPDRLMSILRQYFSRLPNELNEFSTRAAAASTLGQLVQLRTELSFVPRPGRWSKFFRQTWG
jgi:hypothetical protein